MSKRNFKLHRYRVLFEIVGLYRYNIRGLLNFQKLTLSLCFSLPTVLNHRSKKHIMMELLN